MWRLCDGLADRLESAQLAAEILISSRAWLRTRNEALGSQTSPPRRHDEALELAVHALHLLATAGAARTCGASRVRNSAMSEMPLLIESGVMPCLVVASCRPAAISPSERAADRLRVLVGATSTLPLLLRGAAIVWISAVWPEKPLSASARRPGTPGRSASRRRLTPTRRRTRRAQVADDLIRSRVSISVEVARLHPGLEQVVGRSWPSFRQGRDERPLVLPRDGGSRSAGRRLRASAARPPIDDAGRPDQLLGDPGRMAELPRAGRGGDEHELRHLGQELVGAAAGCRAPREGGSRSRPTSLARAVALVHAAICGIVCATRPRRR